MNRNTIFFSLLPGLLVGLLWIFLVAPRRAAAQEVVTLGSVQGTVEDSSGATLPGVTVTLTSPALQVPQIVKTTDERGYYDFPGLPLGTYTVTFELTGFTKLTREDIVITAGFTARVDVALQVGTVQQTVTVTGETPLIDVTTTRGGGTLTAPVMAAIPNGHTFNDILALTPGLTPGSPSQAGLIGFGALASSYNSYSFPGQDRNFMEGIDFHDSEGVDFAMAGEVDTKTFGTTAETQTTGAQVSIIAKSGSNAFHSRLREEYFNQDLDLTNVGSYESQGIVTGNALLFSSDFVGDLGGPIVHDKLWFYGGIRFQRNRRTVTGFCNEPGPGLPPFGPGSGCSPGEPTGRNNEATAKVSWQASPRNLFIGFYNRGSSDDYQSFASRFIPQESTEDMYYVLHHVKAEWQGTLSSNLLVDVILAKSFYQAQYRDDSVGSPTDPSTSDLTTQIVTGESFDSGGRANLRRDPEIPQFDATVSYSKGVHQLKFGYNVWHHFNTDFAPNLPDGNMQLIFKTTNGVPHQPYEVAVVNRPFAQGTELAYDGAFVTDNWRISRRLTANLGVRMDRPHPFTLASIKLQGTYGSSGFYPSASLGLWTAFQPRAGIAWDIFGNGRTVAKASYGRYGWDFGDSAASVYDLNSQTVTTYKWHAPMSSSYSTDIFVPGETNFGNNSPDFVSVSGTTNPVINHNLKMPETHQVSASVEEKLSSTMSMRVLYVFWETVDNFATINPLRPYSAYDVPIVVHDPGPCGCLTNGPALTIYDLSPAYKGMSEPTGNTTTAQEPVNRPPGRNDYANSFEATVAKKEGRLYFETSFLASKNHAYIVAIPQSPNDLFAGINQTWTLNYRIKANYEAPHGIELSVADLIMNGVPGQRTNLFTGLPTLGSVTIDMTPFGAVHGALRESLDFRIGKRVKFREKFGFEADADVLNVLNNHAAWTTSYQSGPTYNFASTIAPPLTTRLTATFDF